MATFKTNFCFRCRYYESEGVGIMEGECHRYPPITPKLSIDNEVGIFPFVDETDWCGEFQPILKTEED